MTGPAVGARAPGALETIATPTKRRRRPGSIVWWIVFLLGFLYFFLPLLGTFAFSMRSQPLFSAYAVVVDDPKFSSSLLYSFTIGVITIIVSIVLIVPTAFWVRLRLPRLRPYIEFITLLPFVIPPIILVFGLLRSYSSGPLPLAGSDFGSDILLVCAYVVLSLPYMYRAVDTGLRTIDVRSLTEASQSLGAGWFTILVRVIFPNLRVSLLSGAFLTLAIVVGEFTIATFLGRNNAFGPYISLLGGNRAYEPAAVSLISFGLTWIAMGIIAVIGRSSRNRIEVTGAH
ncbi:MAG: putative spermidine/putrescine transport system permease protein [Chloroflexota bacterium]|jgi:putative spermidine/putrescine transport system permease protein|nr:putative spermidine/putrescine transport system permease protein [Chloroflexota bacterium]